jgi:hypothetical protein
MTGTHSQAHPIRLQRLHEILFLHGWQSVPGGVKPTYLAQHGHEVITPKLPDEDFEAALRIAQAKYDRHRPDKAKHKTTILHSRADDVVPFRRGFQTVVGCVGRRVGRAGEAHQRAWWASPARPTLQPKVWKPRLRNRGRAILSPGGVCLDSALHWWLRLL